MEYNITTSIKANSTVLNGVVVDNAADVTQRLLVTMIWGMVFIVGFCVILYVAFYGIGCLIYMTIMQFKDNFDFDQRLRDYDEYDIKQFMKEKEKKKQEHLKNHTMDTAGVMRFMDEYK
jgi:hypothetical protein